MKYILASGWDEGAADLTERLQKELSEGKKVLWLVSGGSNVQAAVRVMEAIPEDLSGGLSVTLVDERYGEPGHADSNWQQLTQAGFQSKQAALLPVLEGNSFDQTAENYGQMLEKAFADNDIVVALLGIGSDGHTAGILPDSPAADEDNALVTAYEAPPLRRLTLTFPALRRIDVAYVFAFGEAKLQALATLKAGSAGLAAQPCLIIRELPEAYVYSDQTGEEADV